MTVDNKNSHHNYSKDPSHGTPSRASSFGEDNPENIEGMNGENELLDSDSDNENDDGHHHHRSNNEDSESALVGSISHILRTLFRDLYQHPAMEPGTEKTKGKLEKINDNEDNEADNDVARVEDDINQPPEISTNIKSTPEPPASVKRRESSRSSFRDPSSDEGIAKQIDRPMSPGGFSDDDEENGDEEEDDGGGGDNEENKVDNENKNEFGDQSIEGGGGDDDGGGESRNNSQNFDGTQFNGTMLQNDSKQPSGDLKVEEKKKRNEEEEDGKEKLNANQRAAVEAMRKIDKKLEAQLAECSKTIQMLKEARKNAEIADKEEENKLKGRGILVSAHIPIGPSHLTRTLQEAKEKIKNDELAEIAERRRQGLEEVEKYPSLVSELISARSLMLASLNKHLYKSGNLKREDMIAINSDDDAEEGGSRGGSKKMSVNPADEHDGFLKMTKSLKVRKSMVLSISHGPNGHRKHKKTISGAESEMDEMLREAIDNEMYDDDEAKSPSSSSKTAKLKSQQIDKSSSTTHHHKKKEKIVNGEQHDLDMKVLQRMEQKLKFTGNPRHDPSNKNNHRLLTLPPPAPLITTTMVDDPNNNEGGGGTMVTTMKNVTGLMAPIATADTEQLMNQWEARKVPAPPGDHGFFVSSPSIIEFTEYDVNGSYTAVVHVRNVTTVARSLTILPLTTHFFAIDKVDFPSANQGTLAPGMSVAITVRFEPDSLADYEDHLTIKNEGRDFPVHVWAHRPPPILSIPTELDIGACLVGDAKSITFKCKNSGGRGKFRLLCPADFPEPRTAQRNLVSLRMDPFNVTPTEFSLDNGEEISIIVEYIPLELGSHKASFVLVCDNCQVSTYAIKGRSEEVALSVCEVNGGQLESHTELRQLHFDPLPVSAKAEQTFTLKNTTCLDLKFRWDFRNEEIDVVIGTSKKASEASTNNKLSNNGNNNDYVEPYNGFSIKPSCGVISAKQDQLFISEFSPISTSTSGCRAVLVIEEIPPPAVPSGQQALLLESLKEEGHGEFLRLEAWFKAMCTHNKLQYPKLHEALEKLNLDSHKRALRDMREIWKGDGYLNLETFMSICPVDVARTIEAKQPRVPVRDIQNNIRRNVETIALLLKGAGEDVVVSLSPPSIQIPGGLLVSQSYVKKVLVTNLSNCITTFSFGSALVDQQDDPGSENEFPVDLLDQHKQMLISVEPRSATLTAKGSIEDNDKENSLSSSIEVLVCITPLVAGRIDATLPCITGDLNNLNNNNNNGLMKRVSSNNSNVITQELVRYRSNPTSRNIGNNCVKLRIGVDAVGPRIAFNQPEVDLGLMAVLGKMSVPISFTNCGEVDCSWTMKQVESLNDSKHTHHAARNPRSSLITGKPFATLQCSPETGLLGPHETATTYVICECGHSPERLRSTLTCIIKGVDQTADAVFEPQYVSVRGEVQAPKVYLDISELNLGTCFIGVPVTRTVTLHNLSNLSTQFKWQRCLGPNPAGFHFKFEPSEGTIGEKQTLKVKFTMTAKTSGVLSELFACECHGMHRPIGFELKSSIRGVVVAYEAIDDNATSLPQPLGKPTDVQYMGSSPLPVAGIAPKFNFGDSVPLFERRIIRFAIRNLSAIACPFTIQPCRYKVSADYNPESKPSSPVIYGDNDNRQNKKKNKKNPYSSLNNHNNLHSKEIKGLYDQEVLSETGSGGGRTRSRMNSAKKNMGRLLDNRHEPKAVYQSVAGKAHIMHRIEKMEDRKVLSRRNGAAFAVSPSSGTLQPWGCVIVTVAAFNEMPGVYDDDLECVLEGALLTRLNLHMSVTGCPLKLAEDCVGLDSNTIPGKPRLQFGDILNGSPDTTKLVRIRNEGPIGARVSWSVRSPEDDGDEAMDNRFVDLSIAILPTKKTKNMKDNVKKDMASLKIKWHTRKAYTAPYSVEPSSAVIKPHSSTNFKVTLHGSAIPNNEHTDFSDLLGNINPLDKRINQDGSTTNSSGGGGGNFESFLESDYASSAGDDDMSSQHTEDNSFAGCILDRSGTLSRIDSVGVHDGGGGGSVSGHSNSGGGSGGGGGSVVNRNGSHLPDLNVDMSSLASFDGSTQMAPSIHHDTLEKKVQSFDLVQAVMVLNAEWLHDKEGNENGNGTTLHSRGSTSSNSSNSAITMGVFNTDGRHQSKGNNRKSLATSMMSPGKRSTQQQFGSRANSKPQDKMARTTLGAIKVYLTATPTAPHLLLDKQVHADKDNDQFLRFSALSTQIHSMEKITAAINAMLPKASVIMASQDKKNKHGTTTTTQPPQFSSSGFKRRNSGTLVDNSDDHLSKNNELSVQDLINYQLRAVVLTNPLGMPLTFSISSTDPFRVLGSKCLAPPHPLNKGMMASALAANGNGGNLSFPGGIFTLPPQEAVTLYLAYLPSVANQGITSASGPLSGASTPLRKVMNNKNDLSRSISGNVTHDSNNSSAIVSSSNFNNDLTTRLGGAAAAAGGGGGGGGGGNSNNNSNSNVGELNLKNESEGTLAIHFSTGQVQRMKLVGVVSRPMVVCAPAEYDFGLVHTESSSEFLLFLSNPTKVDAKWNVVHVPVSTPKYNITLDDDLKSSVTDNPNVFSFGQLSGVQQGPCYPLVAAGSSLPLDFNQRTKPGFQQQNLNSTAIAWNEHTTLLDRLKYRNNKNYKEPLPIKVVFRPFANQSYQSRYRFIVENGEGFDVVFSGKGTYEENTLQNRAPKVGPRMYDGF